MSTTAMIRGVAGLALGAALLTAATPASANFLTYTFDDPITLSPTQAPGTWYTDRYAPNGFAAPTSFGGDNRLKVTISSADSAANRPPAFSSTFYNTQGRKFDTPGSTWMSIDLYVPAAWDPTMTNNPPNQRMAGFWGTAFDGSNSIAAFPIIEFTTLNDVDGTGARFRGWDSTGAGSWVYMGLPTGFMYDSWYTLQISLDQVADKFVYQVGNLTQLVDAFGANQIGNVILQAHNLGTGYDVYWDNLKVAEPHGLAALGLGLLGLFALRRRDGATGQTAAAA